MDIFTILSAVMVSYLKTHWIAYFKYVQIIVCQLYLNKNSLPSETSLHYCPPSAFNWPSLTFSIKFDSEAKTASFSPLGNPVLEWSLGINFEVVWDPSKDNGTLKLFSSLSNQNQCQLLLLNWSPTTLPVTTLFLNFEALFSPCCFSLLTHCVNSTQLLCLYMVYPCTLVFGVHRDALSPNFI